MGFLRKWYRDSVTEPKERARMLLADGEYASAASEFLHCKMYGEAAAAYMKAADALAEAGDTERAWHEYRSAIKWYDKAGHKEGLRQACEKCWRIEPTAVYENDLQRLVDLGLIEQFITNAREHEPWWLAGRLERIDQFMYAAETYAAAAVAVDQLPDGIRPDVVLEKAIECGKKASLEAERLLKLHEEFFRTVISQPNPKSNIEFFVNHMSWLLDSGNLERFIDDFLEERAIFLCFVLDDFMDIIEKPIDDKVVATIANCMLRCLKEAQEMPLTDPDWEIIDGRYRRFSNAAQWLSYLGKWEDAARVHLVAAELDWRESHMEEAVECYQKANHPLKAAGLLEQLGRFKEAAGLAEDSGDTDMAIRLYEQTLKQGRVEGTEAQWIKTTLERLRGTGKEPVAVETDAPVAGEAVDGSEAHRSCPKCGVDVPEGDDFCSDCGHQLGRDCPNCGAEVAQGKKFCGKCGHSLIKE